MGHLFLFLCITIVSVCHTRQGDPQGVKVQGPSLVKWRMLHYPGKCDQHRVAYNVVYTLVLVFFDVIHLALVEPKS